MQKILLFIDKISTFVGQVVSWLIVGLTFLIAYEVYARYAMDAPHSWAFDIMLQMYGILFMMAGAYTLSKNGMVRGDILYGFFPQRVQAAPDLTLYIIFFLPGVTALCWAGTVSLCLEVDPGSNHFALGYDNVRSESECATVGAERARWDVVKSLFR